MCNVDFRDEHESADHVQVKKSAESQRELDAIREEIAAELEEASIEMT